MVLSSQALLFLVRLKGLHFPESPRQVYLLFSFAFSFFQTIESLFKQSVNLFSFKPRITGA